MSKLTEMITKLPVLHKELLDTEEYFESKKIVFAMERHWLFDQLQMVTSEMHIQARIFILTSDAIHELVVVSSIQRQAKQVRRTKQVWIISPWPLYHFLPPLFALLSSFHDFIWWWTVMWESKLNKPFTF